MVRSWLARHVLLACAVVAGCDRAASNPGTATSVTGKTIAHGGHAYRVVRVPAVAAGQLRLLWRDDNGAPIGDLTAVERRIGDARHRLVFATNAGIFDPTRSPLGLHIEDGKVLVDLNRGDGPGNFYLKPNGVFFEADGKLQICETSEFTRPPGRVRFATQSGPLLLRAGREHGAFDADSANRRVRSAVDVDTAGDAVFVLSEGRVTFHELASFYHDRLECADALYLDGEISKFYAPRYGWNDGAGQFAAVIAVVEPNPAVR